MINAQKIIRLVRFKEKDNNEIKFSDYDIIQSLNEVIRYLNMRLSTMNADFLERTVLLDEKEINEEIDEANALLGSGQPTQEHVVFPVTGVELPDDYLSLMAVLRTGNSCCCNDYRLKCVPPRAHLHRDEYYIMGNRLYAACHTVRLYYRAKIDQVTDADDTIDLPEFFMDGLAKMTSMILNNSAETDVMREAIDREIDRMIPHRRYSNVRVAMPWQV